MSSIVLYKGSELTRISNATKTLTTAGTWLEDDIEITDQTVLGVYTTEETDLDGYPIGILTAVDLSYDTVSAEHLEYEYTAHDYLGRVVTGVLVPGSSASGTISITQNGTYDVTDYASAAVSVTDGDVTLQAKTSINPTTSSQTIGPDIGYDGLSSVQINPIDPTFIGSQVPRKGTNDLTVSGGTVSVSSGYYENQVSATVQSGVEGTPVATKGSVSNHSISITPSVTNEEGYISGGSHSGTAVSVSASELVSGTKSISANGTGIDVTNYASVDVSVSSQSPELQSKSVSYTPTTSQQSDTVTADSGYDGLSSVSVTVDAVDTMTLPSSPSSTSSGTSLSTISRSNSTRYLNIPAGYNETAQYYTISAVSDGTAGTPVATKGTVANNSVTITPSVTNTTGFINGGTIIGNEVQVTSSELVSGTYSVTSSGTADVTNYASISVPAGTVTPASTITGTSATVTTGTNTITLSKSVSNTPSVSTAGYISSGTAGNSSVSLTASVTTKGATTYHPSTTSQSIASGTYLTGAQTINPVTVSGLSASNILSGVTVKVGDSSDDDCVTSVTGSLVVQDYYTGSSAPSSSLGNNGDIYLQVSSS